MRALGRFINVLIIVAWIGGAYFIYSSFTEGPPRQAGSTIGFPGTANVTLEPGDYKVWTRNPEGGALSTSGCDEDARFAELKETGVTLTPAGGGGPVELQQTGCSRTNSDGIQSSVAKYEVSEAGTYVLAAKRNPAPTIPDLELYLGGGGLGGGLKGALLIGGLMVFTMFGLSASARLTRRPPGRP